MSDEEHKPPPPEPPPPPPPTEAQVNALNCALAVFQGTAGGFSHNERQAAYKELQNMFSVYRDYMVEVSKIQESK